MGHVHIIGAGLSGLSAAVELAARGRSVTLYEASRQAGGRCRSYHDGKLDCEIDNGNHLLLSGNKSAARFLDMIGAGAELTGPERAVFPFMDIRSRARWDIEFNAGRLPLWVFDKHKRVPGAGLMDHLALSALLKPKPHARLSDYISRDNPLYENLIEPLSVAVINMAPDQASAKLMGNVLGETLLKGGRACQPRVARDSLGKTFIDPALNYLKAQGAKIEFGTRLKSIGQDNVGVKTLHFTSQNVSLADGDYVISALPPEPAGDIFDFISVPSSYSAIVNLHYRLTDPIQADWPAPLMGLIGSLAQWVFIRGDIASVTISAADAVLNMPSDVIAKTVWEEISIPLHMEGQAMPPVRVVKEKRATLAQNPELEPLRPGIETPCHNLFMVGDWTDTGLPATIEGAIRSGANGAKHILREMG